MKEASQIFQDKEEERKEKPNKKGKHVRPVTPLVKIKDKEDMVLKSQSRQIIHQRSSSTKRSDSNINKDMFDEKKKYIKAKIGWTAASQMSNIQPFKERQNKTLNKNSMQT